jgi:hypothetical protein
MTIKCNAALFRLATLCQSKEQTRFYLGGVYIEPHSKKGVIMTTTDGHRLVSIYDVDGSSDEPGATIALSQAALKECKVTKDGKRLLAIEGNTAVVVDHTESVLGDSIAISPKCRVGGTFPDWRHIVPTINFTAKSRPGHFNGTLLATFGEIAAGLSKESEEGGKPVVRILSNNPSSAALVLFGNDDRAFGILMPVRGNKDSETVPAWMAP